VIRSAVRRAGPQLRVVGALLSLAQTRTTRIRMVDTSWPCPECGLVLRLALTHDLGRCIYCRRVFTGRELMEMRGR
jgi:hypothetical protein